MSLLGSLARGVQRFAGQLSTTLSRTSRSQPLTRSTRSLSDFDPDSPVRQSTRHVPRYTDVSRGEVSRPEYIPFSDQRVVVNEDTVLPASRREAAFAGSLPAGAGAGIGAAQSDAEPFSEPLEDRDLIYIGDR
jgi:hypothetical protein